MKTTITPAVVKTVSPKTINVELTVDDAAVVAALISNVKHGKKYTDSNTCLYALFDRLTDFISGENGKTWEQHIDEYVDDKQEIRLN
jgi:hypothetical protein